MLPGNKMYLLSPLLIVAALLAACSVYGPPVPPGVSCDTNSFRVTDDFAGARRGSCTVMGDSSVRLEILREDDRVTNPSPWYAFKVTPGKPGIADITLDYLTWEHRYLPKISNDGKTWQMLDETLATVSTDKHLATLRVPLTDEPVWVAAQELITPDTYTAWNRQIAERYDIDVVELGRSARDQAIDVFDSNGEPRITVIKGTVDESSPTAQYELDGLAGATLTGRGITALVH